MRAPTNVKLVQMHEGYVAIEIKDGNVDDDQIDFGDPLYPANGEPTHLKIYLSTISGQLGNLHATVSLDCISIGGLYFNVTPGWFGYATVRAYSRVTLAESTNTNQITLQMFERVIPGYNIIHFFHDKRANLKDTQYAIGYRQSDNAVFIMKSSNYFTTWTVVKYWPPGVIDNGTALTFYIDIFRNMYVANRPSALISKDNGATWQQLPWSFQTPAKAELIPFWNITEDENSGLIIFSEYGSAKDGPHHMIAKSYDPSRTIWSFPNINPPLPINWGKYRHIHGYHINPYMTHIHFLFLGDPLSNQPLMDHTPGFYLSQDSGNTWSSEILNQGGNTVNFGGDQKFRNAPTNVTWWKSGKAFIANDSGQRSVAAWYGDGPVTWGYPGLYPKINLLGNIDRFCSWPATPWDAKAVEGGYETYCANHHFKAAFNGDSAYPSNNPNLPGGQIAYTPPSVLWRYDPKVDTSNPPNPQNDGNQGTITIIAKAYWPAIPFLYISAGRNNTFPDNADYIFCNAWGGIRIPRKVIKNKSVVGVINTDPNTNIGTG